MTEAELQLDLMSYADRYASVAAQAIDDVERMGPPPETRRAILGDLVYSTAAAFTIAAEPDPQLALLDLVVLDHDGADGVRGLLATAARSSHRRP